jgi:hypothetical protein
MYGSGVNVCEKPARQKSHNREKYLGRFANAFRRAQTVRDTVDQALMRRDLTGSSADCAEMPRI